jgi:hypothetical protein
MITDDEVIARVEAMLVDAHRSRVGDPLLRPWQFPGYLRKLNAERCTRCKHPLNEHFRGACMRVGTDGKKCACDQ